MKIVNRIFIYLFIYTGLLLLSANTVNADDNPFSQKNTPSSVKKQRTFSQGMCGMGRCGRCGGCGGGMMWGGKGKPKIGDITQLPEPQSHGAKLINRYCTQCHTLPNPNLHSAEGWLATVERMNARMQWMSQNGNDIVAPSETELEILIAYLREYSKKE